MESKSTNAWRCLSGLTSIALLALVSGCVGTPTPWHRDAVSALLEFRTNLRLGEPVLPDGQPVMPNGADLADGLAEDEAVLIALWNNAAFQERLAELEIARGDLIQAGLLPNPDVAYFFHVPGKAYKYALELPLEALWLRPIRLRAAASESARVAESLTQGALDLIRNVRQAYADAELARARLKIAEEAVQLRGQISRLADARLRAGDVSVQEATTARIDLLRAQQDRARVTHDVDLADERLRLLMGLGADRTPLRLTDAQVSSWADLDPDALCTEAVATRPDVLAAHELVAAALERLHLAQINWIRFNGILDATSGQRTGHEFGPALRMTLPILNWNQGGKVRARGELEKAEHQRQALQHQIAFDVRQAHYRYVQVRAELEILTRQVRPEVEAAIQRAESAYREGLTPYVVVLETTRQLLDSRLREVELRAEQRRAWAELERSVGRKLDTQPMIDN